MVKYRKMVLNRKHNYLYLQKNLIVNLKEQLLPELLFYFTGFRATSTSFLLVNVPKKKPYDEPRMFRNIDRNTKFTFNRYT